MNEKTFLRVRDAYVKAMKANKNYKARVLLVTEDGNIFSLNEKRMLVSGGRKRGYLPVKMTRGSILEAFSQIEFLINELIVLHLLGQNPKNGGELDALLGQIDLHWKIKVLEEWGLLEEKLVQKLMKTKKVRNEFAHVWETHQVMYEGKQLMGAFPKFEKNMKDIWDELLDAYRKEQKKIDIDALIEEFENDAR